MSPNRLKYLATVVAYHRAQSEKSGFWETGMDNVEGSYDAIISTAAELLKAAEHKAELEQALRESIRALACARQQLAGSKPLSGVHASSLRADVKIVDGAAEKARALLAKLEGK